MGWVDPHSQYLLVFVYEFELESDFFGCFLFLLLLLQGLFCLCDATIVP